MKWMVVFVAVVVAMFAFVLFGTHFITKIIDDKIGDIKVNMPRINVNPPQLVVRVTKDTKGNVTVRPDKPCGGGSVTKKLTHPNRIQTAEPFLAVEFDDEKAPIFPPPPPFSGNPDDIKPRALDAPVIVNFDDKQPKLGCRTDADCNVVNGDGKNVCKSDGTCACIGGGSGLFCHYGPVNYRDPKDMTADELQRFKTKFRSNFTLQDYKNWLLLYKKDPENLREQHRRNLTLLLQGSMLTAKDIPTVRVRAPTNASDYFQNMYQGANIAVHFNDQDSPYVGANYNDYGDFVPPENIANSWVTGIVNAYKNDGKDDARAIDWYMLPETTTGEDEQRAGDIYQRYVQRQHNLADARVIAGQNLLGRPMCDGIITRGDKDLQTFTEAGVSLT